MEALGNCGRSSRHYEASAIPSCLNGILTSDEVKVFPEDRCEKCEAEGRIVANEKCFRKHWLTKKERKEAQ